MHFLVVMVASRTEDLIAMKMEIMAGLPGGRAGRGGDEGWARD